MKITKKINEIDYGEYASDGIEIPDYPVVYEYTNAYTYFFALVNGEVKFVGLYIW